MLEREIEYLSIDDVLLAVLLVEASGKSQEQAVDDIDAWMRPFDRALAAELRPPGTMQQTMSALYSERRVDGHSGAERGLGHTRRTGGRHDGRSIRHAVNGRGRGIAAAQ